MHALQKNILRVAAAFLLGSLLLLPSGLKFAHDLLEDHDHAFCALELEGEIHYHQADLSCDFQPVYLSPFQASDIDLADVISNEEKEELPAIPKTHYARYKQHYPARGPPIS